MAEDITPPAEDNAEAPEVEAHTAEEVLGLQGISIEEAERLGVLSPGSCSSCAGSLCN